MSYSTHLNRFKHSSTNFNTIQTHVKHISNTYLARTRRSDHTTKGHCLIIIWTENKSDMRQTNTLALPPYTCVLQSPCWPTSPPCNGFGIRKKHIPLETEAFFSETRLPLGVKMFKKGTCLKYKSLLPPPGFPPGGHHFQKHVLREVKSLHPLPTNVVRST